MSAFRSLSLFIIALVFGGCEAAARSAIDVHYLAQAPPVIREAQVEVVSPKQIEPLDDHVADPYASWQTWCEGPTTPCTKHEDCALDRTGLPRRCIRPWWSKGEDKVCAVGFPGPLARKRMKAKIATIAELECRGRSCDADELARFLGLVASRESSYRPWKQHRLSPDIKANQTTWWRYKKQYAGNAHWVFRKRWQGWGPYGQNSGTFVMQWDRKAPPEILCREIEATEAYLTVARRAWRKQLDLGITPTWATVHAAASSGKVLPKPKDTAKFEAQARRGGLDATSPLPYSALGAGLGKTSQIRNATAALLRADMIARDM